MRYAALLALSVPLIAAAPPVRSPDNAVEIEKKRFEDLRHNQFPLWPEKLKPETPRVTLPRKPARVEISPAPSPCAVPLTNALRPSTRIPPMPRFRPDPGRSVMPEVRVPAPSCDDVGRK